MRFSKNRTMTSSESSRMFYSCLSLENEWVLFWVKENSFFNFCQILSWGFAFYEKNKIFQKIIKIINKLLLWWCLTWWLSCWSSSMNINHINWWSTFDFLVEYQGVEFQSQLSGVENDFSTLFTLFENHFFLPVYRIKLKYSKNTKSEMLFKMSFIKVEEFIFKFHYENPSDFHNFHKK